MAEEVAVAVAVFGKCPTQHEMGLRSDSVVVRHFISSQSQTFLCHIVCNHSKTFYLSKFFVVVKMSSSDEEEEMLLLLLLKRKQNNRRKRRFWVHPFFTKNQKHSATIIAKELSQDTEKFKTFYRMSQTTFRLLLQLVGPKIMKKDSHFRKAISPQEKLLITLRYLATGCNQKSLTFIFMRGRSAIGKIIEDTTRAIWETLQPIYMPEPDKEKWLHIAERNDSMLGLPNCLGYIDGKHIRIKKFAKTGSLYHNYKHFFSMVLMATSDADGLFITIDVGEFGKNSDGGVFRESNLNRRLLEGSLNIPEMRALPNDTTSEPFPFYFIGDEAFPLRTDLLRPFPQRSLTNAKRIFNYRISRGRNRIECAFGMLNSKFRIFETPICCKAETVENIIKSACVLHNFVRRNEGVFSSSASKDNTENMPANISICPVEPIKEHTNIQARNVRNKLANYFLQPENALPWQWSYCCGTQTQ